MARANALRVVGLDERLPAPDEVRSARELLGIFQPLAESRSSTDLLIRHQTKDHEVSLSPAVAQTLVELLRLFASGQAVTLVPVGATLTSQQAADVLNVSRPYLIKLLDAGEIGYEKVGRHRRIAASELLAYKARRDSERRSALAEMAAMSAEEDDL
ncbi:MAG: helix-turn-helix domain-containing protein [Alphaproteobacteria bacterium]|nr:MAG: helix-turn-helix domain-containing protein [Alphaproteobacteria bacterium]